MVQDTSYDTCGSEESISFLLVKGLLNLCFIIHVKRETATNPYRLFHEL